MAVTPPSPSPAKWEEPDATFRQRGAFVAIWGPQSAGKTSLALTAGGPTALLHSGEKINGVYQPYIKTGQSIKLYNFAFTAKGTADETAEAARLVWGNLKRLYLDSTSTWAKTTIIDTEPDAWALRRFAKFGTLQPKGDTRDLYTSVNFDWNQLLKARYRTMMGAKNKNLITIHTSTDEYKDILKRKNAQSNEMVKESVKTGKERMEGMKKIPYWADVILYAYKDIIEGKYHVRIDKGWFNGQAEGLDLTHDFMESLGYEPHPVTQSCLHFNSIMAFITDTPEAEWKK